jgi:hypothetical protein
MRLRGLLLALFALAAGPVQAAGRSYDSSQDRLTAVLVKAATAAFPLTVMTIHRQPEADGAVTYVIRLDTRNIPAAPRPVMEVFITFPAGARTDQVYPAVRGARAEVITRLEAHRQTLNQPVQLQHDLIAPPETELPSE